MLSYAVIRRQCYNINSPTVQYFLIKVFEDLVALVSFFALFNNADIVFYTTFEKRSSNNHLKLRYLCEKYSLEIKRLNLPGEFISKKTQTTSTASSHEIMLLQINKIKSQ